MDDIDLDSFIANVELTAPEDSLAAKLTCNECGGLLEEEEDGHFVCPLCSVQASNILQLDETELHHDENGRPVYGQRVRIGETKSKHSVDYGWSWSTDDAILHILKLQLDSLRSANLISDSFIDAVYNMWERFWLQSVAPHIRDEYPEGELVPISASKALKLRDIEVLVKVKDKVMIPFHLLKSKSDLKNIHNMCGTQFFRSMESTSQSNLDSNDTEDEGELPSNVHRDRSENCSRLENQDDQDNQEAREEMHPQACVSADGLMQVDDLKDVAKHCRGQTKTLSGDSIEVLTLNRTLAFIEAVSRCLRSDDPLFASDLIRACNQRIIPFYGASRLLPENMKFDQRDKLGFQKTRPPTPTQLSRAAHLLITNIYKDKLPRKLRAPNMDSILERFIKDMNLPKALFEAIKGKVTFNDFRATQPLRLKISCHQRIPQYDRWAYAVLVMHLKIMFNLSDRQLIAQKHKAMVIAGDETAENYFIFHDWIRQMSLRLELILRHDPFVLYHPMNEIERMVPTSQLAKYLEQIIEDRNHAELTLHTYSLFYDDEARRDLADLLNSEFPPPPEIASDLPAAGEQLRISKEVKYPIGDAFRRTQHFWVHKLDSSARELVFKSFAGKELVLLQNLPAWCIYDGGHILKGSGLEIPTDWPDALKLLLHVGAFLCVCEPVDLLEVIKIVEESYHPQVRVIKKINNAKARHMSRVLNRSNTPRTYANRRCSNE